MLSQRGACLSRRYARGRRSGAGSNAVERAAACQTLPQIPQIFCFTRSREPVAAALLRALCPAAANGSIISFDPLQHDRFVASLGFVLQFLS